MSDHGAARALLLRAGVERDLCESLRADEDLLSAGVGSAQMIELMLLVEDALGVELTAEQVERLSSIRDVQGVMSGDQGVMSGDI